MRRVLRATASRLLRPVRVVHRASGEPPAVALTFDDGPSEWTQQIAGTLESHGCRATFFLLGSAVERQPDVVAALARAGHELGNHLWSHTHPARQSRARIREEIDRTAAAIEDAAGARPTLVRPPYCAAPWDVARAAGRGGTKLVVLRSVDPEDWRTAEYADIVERVLDAGSPGDIVCLHDGLPPVNRGTTSRIATVEAVERLVPALLDRGLRPVTVSELLA